MNSILKRALAICLAAAVLSLTFPFYYRAEYPSQTAGRYFYLFQKARIDWSQTIHGFLLLSSVAIGVVWLAAAYSARLKRLARPPRKMTMAIELVILFVGLLLGLTAIPAALSAIFTETHEVQLSGFYAALISPTVWWEAWGIALAPYIVYQLICLVVRATGTVKVEGKCSDLVPAKEPDLSPLPSAAPKLAIIVQKYRFAKAYAYLCFFGCSILLYRVITNPAETILTYFDGKLVLVPSLTRSVAFAFMFALYVATGIQILRKRKVAIRLCYIGAIACALAIVIHGFIPLEIVLYVPTLAIIPYLKKRISLLT